MKVAEYWPFILGKDNMLFYKYSIENSIEQEERYPKSANKRSY
jgi:hypothetical protein